jgi:endonuclease/exonuclease/phosphatase family metal-dependent hydrolase
MHLFTWNIDKRIAMAPRALAYLERVAERDYVIATLQEWPWEFPDLQGHKLEVVRTGGKALLLYSRELVLGAHGPDASGRATVARFCLPTGSEITAVGVHWHSRDSHSEIVDPYERGGAMALFRHHLDARLSTPAVIMGDFNSSSDDYEREMCSKYCLFALDQRHRSTPTMETVMGQDKRAWVLVEPRKPADAGTFFWNHTQAWSDLDHVILTPDLESRLQGAEVLTSMEGHEFLTAEKRVPRGPALASDHLPVVCRIHYQ